MSFVLTLLFHTALFLGSLAFFASAISCFICGEPLAWLRRS